MHSYQHIPFSVIGCLSEAKRTNYRCKTQPALVIRQDAEKRSRLSKTRLYDVAMRCVIHLRHSITFTVTIAFPQASQEGGDPFLRKEGTDSDARALTNSQMQDMLFEYGIPMEEIRKMKRWDRVKRIREIQTELRTIKSGNMSAVSRQALLFAGELKLSPQERRTLKENQAHEVQARQLAALRSTQPPSDEAGEADGDGDGDDSSDDDEFAAELEKAMDTRIAREKTRDVAAREAAAAEEEEAQHLRELKEGLLARGRGGAAAAASASAKQRAQATAESLAEVNKATPYAFLPLALKLPPHATLSVQGNAAGQSDRDQKSHAQDAAAPVSLASLPHPPRLASFVRDPVTGKWSVAAPPPDPNLPPGSQPALATKPRVLRIVRTTVDEAGRQVVRATYSVSDTAAASAWAKQALNVDLGALAIKQGTTTGRGQRMKPAPGTGGLRMDADNFAERALVQSTAAVLSSAASHLSAGQRQNYVPPTPDQALEDVGLRASAKLSHFTLRFSKPDARSFEKERIWKLRDKLAAAGLVFDGSRTGDRRVEMAQRFISIHGAQVPICEKCRLWGHRQNDQLCPASADSKCVVLLAG
jgi:hypothetical protein